MSGIADDVVVIVGGIAPDFVVSDNVVPGRIEKHDYLRIKGMIVIDGWVWFGSAVCITARVVDFVTLDNYTFYLGFELQRIISCI